MFHIYWRENFIFPKDRFIYYSTLTIRLLRKASDRILSDWLTCQRNLIVSHKKECPASNGEAPFLDIWGPSNTLLWHYFPDSLWPEVVVPVSVWFWGQIDLVKSIGWCQYIHFETPLDICHRQNHKCRHDIGNLHIMRDLISSSKDFFSVNWTTYCLFTLLFVYFRDKRVMLMTIWKSDFLNDLKCEFFQAVAMSVLLYDCTTWTLTKRLHKMLDMCHTKIQHARWEPRKDAASCFEQILVWCSHEQHHASCMATCPLSHLPFK